MSFCVKMWLGNCEKVCLALQNRFFRVKEKFSKCIVIICYIDVYFAYERLLKMRQRAVKNAACCVALHLLEHQLTFAAALAHICWSVGLRSALRFGSQKQVFCLV